MPVMKCQKNNKPGYKFGETGKCFTGKSGRMKAAAQGRAIEASKNRREK